MTANTIDDVIYQLNEIIAWAQTNNSCMGYFAALYRKVTLEVKKKIQAGEFEDNARMEQLDVIFANRYLDAFTAYQEKKPMMESWKIACDTAAQWHPIILQHLLLGMNAHINLDLGIAAASVAPGKELSTLQNDFNKINIILAGLVNDVKAEFAQIWPLFSLLDDAVGETEDAMINFSMQMARDEAWRFAKSLASLPEEAKQSLITRQDQAVTKLGQRVAQPSIFTRVILLIIRLGERGDVIRNIGILV